MAKKFYVVWQGGKTGIFTDWKMCPEAIHQFPGAKYKSFPSEETAQKAFVEGPDLHWGKTGSFESPLLPEELVRIGQPIYPSIAVDAAWNTTTGAMEYQGVDAATGTKIFHQGPFEKATANVGEFLAIIHALAI